MMCMTKISFFVLLPGQINELVDCRDISIGAWFEATIENVTHASKGPKSKECVASPAKSGKSSTRTNGNLEATQTVANMDSNCRSVLNSDSSEPSTSQLDCRLIQNELIYHIKYEE